MGFCTRCAPLCASMSVGGDMAKGVKSGNGGFGFAISMVGKEGAGLPFGVNRVRCRGPAAVALSSSRAAALGRIPIKTAMAVARSSCDGSECAPSCTVSNGPSNAGGERTGVASVSGESGSIPRRIVFAGGGSTVPSAKLSLGAAPCVLTLYVMTTKTNILLFEHEGH